MLATGALVGNALSQSAAGKPGMIETRLTPDTHSEWLIDGFRSYSTGSLFSELLLASGNDEDGAERLALIRSDRPGIETADDWDGMGQRATATGTTMLRGVRIAADELVEFVSLKGQCWRARGAGSGRREPLWRLHPQAGTETAALEAAIEVPRAQVAVAALVLPATQRVFDVGGTSAVTDSVNLHRHLAKRQNRRRAPSPGLQASGDRRLGHQRAGTAA